MSFMAPALLFALLALPVLWWLLRATPPAPRLQKFPAIRLLSRLHPREETPARTPWWLLALRLLAAALLILGLARPVLDAAAELPGGGGADHYRPCRTDAGRGRRCAARKRTVASGDG
jgi:hypothetical protein